MRKFLQTTNTGQAISTGYYVIGNLFGSLCAGLSLWLINGDLPFEISVVGFVFFALLSGFFTSAFLFIIHLIIMAAVAQTQLPFKWQVLIGGLLAIAFAFIALILVLYDRTITQIVKSEFFPYISSSYFLALCIAAWSLLDAGRSLPSGRQTFDRKHDNSESKYTMHELSAFLLLISSGIVLLVILFFSAYGNDLSLVWTSLAAGALMVVALLPALLVQFIINTIIQKTTQKVGIQWIMVCITFSLLTIITIYFISMLSPFEEIQPNSTSMRLYLIIVTGLYTTSGLIVYRFLMRKSHKSDLIKEDPTNSDKIENIQT